MAHTDVVYRSPVAAPPAEVLAWHARPGAFERLTPPWMDVRVLAASGGIAPGDWKRLRVGFGPIGVAWTLVHRAGEGGRSFVDEQEAGPFRSWQHEHRFESDGGGCVLEDRISYRLPLDAVAHRVAERAVRGRLDEVFRFRHRRTQIDLARHAEVALPRPQRIAVTGTSGLVGAQLVPFLTAGGHEVIRLVRRRPGAPDEVAWDPATGEIDASALEGLDAVVHLAATSIAGRRWTAARKDAIRASRVDGTALLARTLAGLRRPPRVLVSASGVGYYGDAGQSPLTEASPPGEGFLAEVCRAWEDETTPARDAGIRVVLPRIAPVLSGGGGLLPQLARLFRLGLGGRLGSGEQVFSWIALDDLLGVIHLSIADDRLEGPVNAGAPHPVANRDLARTLGRVVGRPAVVRVPATALRVAAGALADELLLVSQRAQPERLKEVGFRFEFPTLESALRHELGRHGADPGFSEPARSFRTRASAG